MYKKTVCFVLKVCKLQSSDVLRKHSPVLSNWGENIEAGFEISHRQ